MSDEAIEKAGEATPPPDLYFTDKGTFGSGSVQGNDLATRLGASWASIERNIHRTGRTDICETIDQRWPGNRQIARAKAS